MYVGLGYTPTAQQQAQYNACVNECVPNYVGQGYPSYEAAQNCQGDCAGLLAEPLTTWSQAVSTGIQQGASQPSQAKPPSASPKPTAAATVGPGAPASQAADVQAPFDWSSVQLVNWPRVIVGAAVLGALGWWWWRR